MIEILTEFGRRVVFIGGAVVFAFVAVAFLIGAIVVIVERLKKRR